MLKRLAALSAAAMLLCAHARADAPPPLMQNYSVNVTTTPARIFDQVLGRSYWRVMNVVPTGGAILWCSRFSATPAANAPGSFPLSPGQFEEFKRVNGVPINQLYCVAATGTIPVTAESF